MDEEKKEGGETEREGKEKMREQLKLGEGTGRQQSPSLS